jgi:Pyruvate/2-oxoacid:ferredoxin oxidoreductase delta subunit
MKETNGRIQFERTQDLPPTAMSLGGTAWNRTGSWKFLEPAYQHLTPPCSHACLTDMDVVGMMRSVEAGDWNGAAKAVLDVNPFPSITGRTCPHPCETPCNRKAYGGGISVRAVERQVGDHKLTHGVRPDLPEAVHERVHVVGAGPAGLSAAVALRRLGHPVTVHGTPPAPGGLLRCGGANDGLPTDVVRAEFAWVAGLGVDFEPAGRYTREQIEALGPTIFAAGSATRGAPADAAASTALDPWGEDAGPVTGNGAQDAAARRGAAIPDAIRHGRLAAHTLHADRTGVPVPPADPMADQGASPEVAKFKALHMATFKREAPAKCEVLDGEYRAQSVEGVEYGLTTVGATYEATRCFKCGTCTDCDNCFHVCPDVAISKKPGGGYVIDLAHCKGCGVCVEECPRAALDLRKST